MKTYPIFAVIQDKPCLVVGGGAVGERKVLDLLAAGARVTVVSRGFTPRLKALGAKGRIRSLEADFAAEHLDGMVLVMGATDAPEVNRQVSLAAQARGIFVNIADAPELCTFIVPATVRRGDLTVAIGTGGASPALARRLRVELEDRFGPEYRPYLSLLKAARALVLAERRGHPGNGALFQRLVDSNLREALAQQDYDLVQRVLQEILGPVLKPEAIKGLVGQTRREAGG